MKSHSDAKSNVPPRPKPDDEEQSKRFMEKARELGVDETGESFDRVLTSISHTKEVKDEPRHQEKTKVAGKVKKD